MSIAHVAPKATPVTSAPPQSSPAAVKNEPAHTTSTTATGGSSNPNLGKRVNTTA